MQLSRKSPQRRGRHGAVGLLALLSLLVLLGGLLTSGVHEHDASPANAEPCPSCVLGHSPALAGSAAPQLPGPRCRGQSEAPVLHHAPPPAFSFAAPLACGPPA